MSTYTQRRENAYARWRDANPMSADEIDDRKVDAIDFAHQTLDQWEADLQRTVDAINDYTALRAKLPPRMDGARA